jgi:hypothetical protein
MGYLKEIHQKRLNRMTWVGVGTKVHIVENYTYGTFPMKRALNGKIAFVYASNFRNIKTGKISFMNRYSIAFEDNDAEKRLLFKKFDRAEFNIGWEAD